MSLQIIRRILIDRFSLRTEEGKVVWTKRVGKGGSIYRSGKWVNESGFGSLTRTKERKGT